MSLAKIKQIIDDLRHERYRWTPARRTYVPKKKGKMRPLGLPSFSDKLLQEVIGQFCTSPKVYLTVSSHFGGD